MILNAAGLPLCFQLFDINFYTDDLFLTNPVVGIVLYCSIEWLLQMDNKIGFRVEEFPTHWPYLPSQSH